MANYSDMAAADAAIKHMYPKPPRNLIIDEVKVLSLVERTAEHINVKSEKAEWMVTVGRNQGTGARAENDELPFAGKTVDVLATLDIKNQFHAVEGTGRVFDLVQGNPEAFINWMTREVNRSSADFKVDLNRQVYGDGTGTLATLTADSSASTTVTVDDVHWLEENMGIDVLTLATLGNPVPTAANGATTAFIVSINETAKTVVLDTAVTALTGSVLVRSSKDGTVGTNNWKKEWNGFGNIISTTSTFAGINPSTTSKWKAGYIGTSTGTLTEAKVTKMLQEISRKGGEATQLLTTPGVGNALWNTVQGMRQFQGNGDLTAGVRLPQFQGLTGPIPIITDDKCPVGTIFAINPKQMFINEATPMQWDDRTGAIWNRVGRKDRFEAWMKYRSNLGIWERQHFGKLTGVTEV